MTALSTFFSPRAALAGEGSTDATAHLTNRVQWLGVTVRLLGEAFIGQFTVNESLSDRFGRLCHNMRRVEEAALHTIFRGEGPEAVRRHLDTGATVLAGTLVATEVLGATALLLWSVGRIVGIATRAIFDTRPAQTFGPRCALLFRRPGPNFIARAGLNISWALEGSGRLIGNIIRLFYKAVTWPVVAPIQFTAAVAVAHPVAAVSVVAMAAIGGGVYLWQRNS